MGLFDFLESQLDEFLRNNPHLELQALEEQLRQQEEDTQRMIIDLQGQEKRTEDEILSTAQQIKLWHGRIDKAKAAGRKDLIQAAQEREAGLLSQGNQLWGKMKGLKERIGQAKELQRKIQVRRQEVRAKATVAQANRANANASQSWETTGWNQSRNYTTSSAGDPLEEKFRRWETDDELERLKRNMGR